MRLLSYLRHLRSLIDENQRLEAENARLRYDLTTALLASWIRRPPKAAAPPESVSDHLLPRATPHRVDPGRHRLEPPTEVHPRVSRRGEPSK